MKIKNTILALMTAIVALTFSACGGEDEPQPAPPAEPTRTVLVYMVADNNLGSRNYDTMDIEEMQKAARAGGIANGHLVIYHSRRDSNDQLLEVKPDGTLAILTEYPSGTISVAASTMDQVIEDTKRFAPADDYGIVLWSHGSGWIVKSSTPDRITTKAYGTDSKGRTMNIPTLASVLDGKGISFVYFDCCYMGAVEVAYELRNVTDYVVASPTELPNEGMPYDKNVPCFFNPNLKEGLINAARNTFEDYDSRTDYNRSCTMGVVRTSALDHLAQVTRAIYTFTSPNDIPSTYKPQKYMYESPCYHFDLADFVHTVSPDAILTAQWDAALAEAVLYEDATPYMWKGYLNDRLLITINTHCGLSTFIIHNDSEALTEGYNTTSWYKDVARYFIQSDL